MSRSLGLRFLRPWVVLALAVAIGAAAVIPALGATHDHGTVAASARTNRAAFHDTMRQLWEDHIAWTRSFIVSFAADQPDLAVVTDRLLRNQDDIGNAIKPFYGNAAGNQLAGLLREHILGAAALLDAAKNGGDVQAASDAWYANANAIAEFLAAANPRFWPLDEMKAMMKDHLDLTLAEAVHRLNGQFALDVADYDQIHTQILHMADMLSDGLIDQFPDKFAL
jgi:hypothetical protein